jgi:transcriptional regulator with XRE-family HTH domain
MVGNMEDNIKLFAKRLRQIREEKGWDQDEVAIRAGLPRSIISFYENMKRRPGYENILILCKTLKVNASYLMGESDIRREYGEHGED